MNMPKQSGTRLKDKVAIITGTAGSIGRVAAQQFCAEGALVVGCDINEAASQQATSAISAEGGSMVSLDGCDLSIPEQANELIELAMTTYGRIDVLYNNAALAHFAWLDEMDHELFTTTLRDEVEVVFNTTKAAWPHLKTAGNASIINTASVSGMICYEVVPGLAHSTAKAGVLGMTRHLAMEGSQFGIRANAISPGLVETNQSRELMNDPDWWGPMQKKIMLGRAGKPEDIAPCAVYLASDESSWVTGANIPIDGGTTAW